MKYINLLISISLRYGRSVCSMQETVDMVIDKIETAGGKVNPCGLYFRVH